MNKIILIIQREYLSRVRKKSFLVMTILGPLLIALMYGAIFWLVLNEEETEYHLLVHELHPAKLISDDIRSDLLYSKDKNVFWHFDESLDLNLAKKEVLSGKYDAVLNLPRDPISQPGQITLHFSKVPSPGVKSEIEMRLERIFETYKASAYGLTADAFDSIRKRLNISSFKLSEDGKDSSDDSELRMGLGIAGGMMIYFFIFLYGAQVLRGVMEEKTSRIVEVLISSVRPFQLMMGKIVGVGLVGLTQFLIWVVLSFVSISIISMILGGNAIEAQLANAKQDHSSGAFIMLDALHQINFTVVILCFLFYFVAGFLLYSSLFAAIGAAVDTDTDSQQFMLPVTLPLIFSVAIATYGIKNPDGATSVFFSIFPLTSPVVMMSRIGFNPPLWEIVLSMILLVLTFLGSTWFAAKIYRTGILMYGKKVTYKELWKWLKYSK
jgi:ABC-2 type transport system permease protein